MPDFLRVVVGSVSDLIQGGVVKFQLIVESNPLNSRINGRKSVGQLPLPLKRRVVDLLKKLPEHGFLYVCTISWADDPGVVTLSDRVGNTCDISLVPEETRVFASQTFALLTWYLNDHWLSEDGLFYCADCGISIRYRQKEDSQFCPNSSCSSHDKWRLVLGSKYRSPATEEDRPVTAERGRFILEQLMSGKVSIFTGAGAPTKSVRYHRIR